MDEPVFHGEKPLRELIAIASRTHLAELHYRKGVTSVSARARIVEPYNLTQGKQDAMVRCYQRQPKEGWRFFMIHKLDRVADTGEAFEPRARITLPTAHVTTTAEPESGWTPGLKGYRNLVSDAMADGVVTAQELRQIEQYKREHNITRDQLRFVHASVFHRCLGAVLDDGIVDDEERRQIRFLNKVLSKLGWSVAD